MKVINPKLTLEDNGAGSLVVTLPPHNAGYASIVRMVTDISVQKDGEEIWAGRVLSESEDFYRNRILYCEGELAYFNDSTQPPAEYSGMSVRGYLERLIAVHNSKVAANRRFTLGAVTVVDKNFPTYYTNHDKTMAVFNAMVEQYGGHLRVRKVDGVRYLDYLAEYPDTCSQVIQFGSNIIDFTKQWDSTEFATVIVPLGNRLEDSPIEALDAYLTVESVNHGSMYVQSNEAVAVYGWIEKAVTWDDVSDPAVLLEKAKAYLSDIQFDNMELELSALDLHYLDVDVEAVKLLDEIRVISRPHGLDRMFPVTKLEIPLDSPEQTQFKLGTTVKTSLTSVNNQISAAILKKIDDLPKAHSILKEAKENATQIMNMATTGYITITKDDYGSETLYISNVRDYTKADKLWKWNMNGLGYSNDGGKTFGLAITMDGSIVADYITTGVLNADVIRAGTLKDYGGNFILDFETGKLTMKRGSINIGNGNFTVDEEGNLYARRGTFAGTLSGAKGTFGGQLVAASGDFKGVVQASDFLDRYGRSMMSGDKFASDYLDLYGLTIRNKNTGATTFAVSSTGVITINGNITMGAGSTINWAAVSNQNLAYNPAYSLADTANTRANRALSDASDAYDMADAAFARANQAYRMADSIEMPSYIRSTYIDSTTIRSPVIEGGEFYGGEFNVIAGGNSGSFNLYGPYGSSRFHMFSISYYDAGVWGPYIYVSSPCGGTICFDGNVEFTGNVEFASAHVHGLSSD
ncbi:phage tail protein [uncultured Duncaniella sp.]|uniref:phage tail protein n=1 Tax=uncultured Duncaniella sp. TaxID=2768039 RepID=UPI00321FF6EA